MSETNWTNKVCDICLQTSEEMTKDLFGPWMQKNDIKVHYFCLLLSSHLPQNGEDGSGICGFYVRDIRAEITAAKKRSCGFCGRHGASIACQTCKIYFHLKCGLRNFCLFQYTGEFKSYCPDCYNLDIVQTKAQLNWMDQECSICKMALGRAFSPVDYLYAACCKNGFVHRSCMQKYAMSAGYYLRCIWCRATSFRESIRQQGIFVPDREARWESRNAFQNLHQGHKRCDMDTCLDPRGREHNSKTWKLINCSLCGSFGVHYPLCLSKPSAGKPCLENKFKCSTCSLIEKETAPCCSHTCNTNIVNSFDSSFYVSKQNRIEISESPISNKLKLSSKNSSQETDTAIILRKVVTDTNISSTTPEIIEPQSKVYHRTDFYSKRSDNVISHSISNSDIKVYEAYEFSSDFHIIGSCKLLNTRSLDPYEIKHGDVLQSPDVSIKLDVVERSENIGIFQTINEFLDKQINVLKLPELQYE